MAAISVVTFGSSPHKVNILQNSTRNTIHNHNHNREVLIVNKTSSNSGPNKTVLTSKKLVKTKDVAVRVSNPTPVAVARRNARERNRVKQVNNGFATLRQHIPPEIAAAFEQAGNGRGANKKLSKVETLRMAVEYIRSLEEILSDDSDSTGNSSVSSGTYNNSPRPSSPAWSLKNTNYQFSLTSTDDDEISINTASPKSFQQYVRIPGTDTFQLITTTLSHEDEENIQPPLTVEDLSLVTTSDNTLVDSPLMSSTDMMFVDSDNLSVFNSSLHPASSLSPDIYSDDSLSPVASDAVYAGGGGGGGGFATLPPIEVLQSRNIIQTNVNLLSPSLSSQSISPRLSPAHPHGHSVITIAPPHQPSLLHPYSPHSEDIMSPVPVEETEEMMEAIEWWQHNQKLRQHGPSTC